MSGERRMPLNQAERLAEELMELLRPACKRIEVAGSIRRRKADVGDIEILAAPKTVQAVDMWGIAIPGLHSNALEDLCGRLLARGVLSTRETNGRGAWGERYKRAAFGGMALDLFAVLHPAQFGVLMLLRTGPADFSRRFVTPRRQGGMLPEWVQVKDGAIWHRSHNRVIETPEEDDVWNLLGIKPIPPEARR